jgi:prephenate dehydrogenase (NADP+)
MTELTEPTPAGMDNFVVGLIGMGDMGRMYAERLAAAGWR